MPSWDLPQDKFSFSTPKATELVLLSCAKIETTFLTNWADDISVLF